MSNIDQSGQLIPHIENILEDIKSQKQNGTLPEHIAQTAHGIENFGHQWADAIEAAAKRQLDEDTKRYEQSIALANQIRQKATEVSKHVSEWALQTRNAGLEIRNVFERLNGGVRLSQE